MSGNKIRRLSAVSPDNILDVLRACWRDPHERPMTTGLALLYAEGHVLLGVWVEEEDTFPHWIDLYTGRTVRNVTHWMPVPEPVGVSS
jgi:hypothetical protein